MKRLLTLLGLTGLALAAPALAAKPPKTPGAGRLTAVASPTPILFGASTVVSGKLTGQNNGNQLVTLAEDPFPYGDGYVDVTTTRTAANGSYSFRRFPPTNRNYRVRARNEQAFASVRVRMRLSLFVSDATPRRGQRVRFSGFVTPKHDGRKVYVQRRSSTGVWVTVRTTLANRPTTGDRSRYSTTLIIRRSGLYRARTLSDGDHLAGTSRTRLLTVG
jgi:hypothetical protein